MMTTAQHTSKEPAWFIEKRKQALVLVEQLPELQREKQEIGMLSLEGFSPALPQQKTTEIVHAPPSVICQDFLTTLQQPAYAMLFQSFFGTIIPIDNTYHALHYAYVKDILFIYVPKGVQVDEPLHMQTHFFTRGLRHVLIIAEPLSKITVIDDEESNADAPGYVSTFIEVVVKEGAEVQFVGLQNHSARIDHYAVKKAEVSKDGKMHWVEVYFGSNYTRSIVTATLYEDGASSTNTTLFFAEGTSKYDIIARTIQIGKHTYADMNTIGVVNDTAKSMCRGLIKIAQSSFGSSGHQKIKTLLMNKDSQANAIPSMEIDNFDVRATHESSVGQISKDKLFYLMSRGLNEQHARMKIVEGYFSQLTKLISHKAVEQKIIALLKQKLQLDDADDGFFFEEQMEDVYASC